jgi:hypothetical protein
MQVLDYMPADSDGTGHWPGIECPCSPCCLTDGMGGFHVYHTDFTERTL